MRFIPRLALTMALATLAFSGAAQAQQQYDPGGKAKVSIYCKNTVAGDTPCPSSGSSGGGSTSTAASSSALAANQVVCASACHLASFNVSADSTLSGAAWWVMIYNATSAPADGSVTPIKCVAAPSGTTSLNGAFTSPPAFATGVVIGVSTTGCFTKTASTHAFISGDSQ